MFAKFRALSLCVLVGSGIVAGAVPAHAATFNVACGSGAGALASAITSANATAAADTIDISGGPCTFTLTAVSNPASGGIGLPIVTQPLTIEGNGSTIERSTSAAASFRILLANDTALTLRNLTIQRGSLTAANSGGAGVAGFLADLTLDRVTLNANSAAGSGAQGGGLLVIGGSIDIADSTFAFNQAPVAGALATNGVSGTVRRSAFVSNAATSSVGAAWVQGGSITFENDTFAGNVAANGLGGLVASNSGAVSGVVSVASSTFNDNGRTNSTAPGGALYTFVQSGGGTAALTVTDSIVADSSTAAAILAPCSGVVNGGGNLEWPTNTCGFATVANPRLGALSLNGGATFNYSLLAGSPAIDLGGAGCPATDQRGVARPDGEACDAGSYEAVIPETSASASPRPTNAPSVTFSSPDTPSATFECKVDSAAFVACTSPFEPSLGDGEHTVQVRAVAPGGHVDPTPASVTFTVDATPPVITASATSDGTPYTPGTWTNDAVIVTFSCDEVGATVSPETLSTEGADQSATGTCSDTAGNQASTTFGDVDIDKTAPTGTVSSGAYVFGTWTNQTVTVAFACADALSGIGTQPADALLASEGAAQTARATCVDNAGNELELVSGAVDIDLTAPTVTWSSHPASYDPGDVIVITCTADDALSGIATSTCADVSAPASTFGPGEHTLTATAVDRAGNAFTATTTFTVTDELDFDALCALTRELVTRPIAAVPLCAILGAAEKADARGQTAAKRALIDAYVKALQVGVRARTLSAANADLLAGHARRL